jgi:hypothetical protein
LRLRQIIWLAVLAPAVLAFARQAKADPCNILGLGSPTCFVLSTSDLETAETGLGGFSNQTSSAHTDSRRLCRPVPEPGGANAERSASPFVDYSVVGDQQSQKSGGRQRIWLRSRSDRIAQHTRRSGSRSLRSATRQCWRPLHDVVGHRLPGTPHKCRLLRLLQLGFAPFSLGVPRPCLHPP